MKTCKVCESELRYCNYDLCDSCWQLKDGIVNLLSFEKGKEFLTKILLDNNDGRFALRKMLLADGFNITPRCDSCYFCYRSDTTDNMLRNKSYCCYAHKECILAQTEDDVDARNFLYELDTMV